MKNENEFYKIFSYTMFHKTLFKYTHNTGCRYFERDENLEFLGPVNREKKP